MLLLIPAAVVVGRWLATPTTQLDPIAARDRLRDAAMQAVADGDLQRDNGDLYAVDVAQLAIYAALAGDRELYEPLRQIILTKLLVQTQPGDMAHGMIAWRYQNETSWGTAGGDASGTTEALRCAEALWQGVHAFGLDEDRDAITLIIDAYARHATTENGTWMIRNYFNLHPEMQTFITNSFLVDYDADLLMQLAGEFGRDDWEQLAIDSGRLIEMARTPAGLLHQMIRPEVGTIMPHLADDGLYSVNGIEQLSNVLTVAERCTTTNSTVSFGVLDFARDRMPQLRLYYDATTGRRAGGRADVPDTWAGIETWGPLLRLAVKLDDPDTTRRALRKVVELSWGFRDYDGPDRMYLIGEALLALEYAVLSTPNQIDTPERTPSLGQFQTQTR